MISIKNIFFNTHYWWLIAIILLFIILYNPLKIESSYAWTFDDASAFIGDKLGIYGIFRLTFTYPTYVQTGEQFSGGITIQYIPSPGSHADWVLLNNISIPLINLIDGKIVKNIIDPNSTILRLNDKYSKLFTIRTPFTPGQYLPDFSFNATAPIGGSIHSRSFGIVEAIKQSTVSPNQQIINSSPLILKVLKPISVNNAPSKNLLNRTLLVQINKILPIQMPFANITVRTTQKCNQSLQVTKYKKNSH